MNKFILMGTPRTGTTVVAGSIISHPEILFYGEIFSNTKEVRMSEAQRVTLGAGWMFDKPLGHPVQPCPYETSTHEYLDAFYNRDTGHKALGFKLMSDQVSQGPNSDIWNYIAQNKDIKIIKTKRDNLLEIICSFVRASMTRHWHTTGHDLPNKNRFVVPPQDFISLVKRFEYLPEPVKNLTDTHEVLELEYENISNDFNKTMNDVYDFLGASRVELEEPKLKKIAYLKPNEELANYDKLKAHFQNTEFEKYFIY